MLSKGRSILVMFGLPVAAVGVLLLLFFLYFPTQAAPGGALVVNSTADEINGPCNAAHCTLREAILAANGTTEGDVISFALPPNSTIVLNGAQLPIITETLTIDGSTAVNLTISGNFASRMLVIGSIPPSYPGPNGVVEDYQVGSSAAVTLTSLTFSDGNEFQGIGGAIVNDGILRIVDSTILNSVSQRGAIYNSNRLIINDSLIMNNTVTESEGGGAGLYNADTGVITVTNSSFVNNSVTGGSSSGGAISNRYGRLAVYDSSFSDNTVVGSGGGGIFAVNGETTIVRSTFSYNFSGSNGGAVFGIGDVTISNSTFYSNSSNSDGGAVSFLGFDVSQTISNSTFYENSGRNGGALYVNSDTFVTNSTFVENSADDEGGAIAVGSYRGDLTLNNSTISGNTASVNDGGGINNKRYLNMTNTIVANSLVGGDCDDDSPIGVNVKNLIEDGSCSPAFSGDPLLGPLADNGGLTLTMMPAPNSLAVDRGTNSGCGPWDQRGWPRPVDGDENGSVVCDIGAVELGKWLEFVPVVFRQ